jgi:predicted molibdopterin-dependent oxidoreductase YjgC
MEEDLARQWANLSLTEDEDRVEVVIPKVQLDKGKNQGKTCVIGKLVADHMVSKETIKKSLKRGWRTCS